MEELIRRGLQNDNSQHTFAPTPGELEKAKQLRALWFDKQAEFFNDPHRRKVGFCTRRSGKTIGFAIFLLVTALEHPTALQLYLAQTAKASRLYMWPELCRLIERFNLPFKPTENVLWISHTRGKGKIVLAGVDNTSEIEKFRGPKWKTVGLDEAATFGEHIEALILESIGPALRDHGGTLVMLGTAGRHKKGLFYEACHGLRKRSNGEPVYKVFKWSLQDNPYLDADAKDEQMICDDEGMTLLDPRFLREYRGLWVTGENERVFSGFDDKRNTWDGNLPGEHRWQYLFGCDFGWHDESAISIVAFSRTSPVIYLCECWSKRHAYADDVAAKIMHFWNQYGKCQVVGDVGGYGKAIQVQLLRDYSILVQTARKHDKLNFIEFQNSAFLRGEIQIHQKEKRMIEQLNTVAWNEARTDAGNHERDDLVFSLTYAWRYARFAGAGKEVLQERDTLDRTDRAILTEKQNFIRGQKDNGKKKAYWETAGQGDPNHPSRRSMWGKIVKGF